MRPVLLLSAYFFAVVYKVARLLVNMLSICKSGTLNSHVRMVVHLKYLLLLSSQALPIVHYCKPHRAGYKNVVVRRVNLRRLWTCSVVVVLCSVN